MTFQDRFRSLPDREQDLILEHVHRALLYRGRDRMGAGITVPGGQALVAIEAIAEIFLHNGSEMEELT